MRVRKSLVLFSFATVAVAGCSPTGQEGTPTTGGSNTQGASQTESTTPSTKRPSVVKLTGVEPCKTLTAAQQAELKIGESVSDPMDIVKSGKPAPNCAYDGRGATIFSYNITLVTDKGVEYWTEGGNLDVKPVEISGFPAKQVTLAGTSEGDCSIAVDTADGQQLFVQFLPIGDGYSQQDMCDNATKGAELALSTIMTLQ